MNANTKNAITKPLASLWLLLPTMLVLCSFILLKDGKGKLKIGSAMPSENTTLVSTKGDTTNLSEAMGANGILVIFSCNTCPFVVGSENFKGWEHTYNSIAEKASEYDINTVLINSNEAKRSTADSMEEMKKRASDQNYIMPYLMDANHVVADAFGAKTTPHIYLFNEDKKLIYMGSIDNSWDSGREEDISYLSNALEQYGNGQKVKQKTTQPRGCSIKRITK
ncbi:MAG: redoxin family protein [Crocinitomicaceae bacterium]